ncbi:SAM-dependent methyltransferase [Longibacter salinarum]|uniref:SAM-dependent methyltransferase n=1 Tax=Longibacter salinarum TaxID=1850348 RepID=A0A2A8CUA3_9BACT|nr:methyltransferase [Longibacter salinarum]PEN11073.1 SAM-dependent methyltransferase [Longibacter salinarum]
MPSVDQIRTPDVTPLLVTTNHGLEDITAKEVCERAHALGLHDIRTKESPNGRTSYVRISSSASPDTMLDLAHNLRSVHHIQAPLFRFTLPSGPAEEQLENIRAVLRTNKLPGMDDAETFRVSTNRRGEHCFTSVDVMRAAGAGLIDQYGTDVDLEDFDLEVRVDVRQHDVTVGIQHTQEPLSRRQARAFQPPAALSPSVAYAMLRLPYLGGSPSTVLDPFCGSGTILIEAARLWPTARVLGLDRDRDAVAGARRNVQQEGLASRIRIHEGDALGLASQSNDKAPDLIVTNPPFGKRLGSEMDLVTFYRRFLSEAHEALPPEGWLVLLVLKPGAFSGALQAVRDRRGIAYDVRHVRRIQLGGLHPRIFVMQAHD